MLNLSPSQIDAFDNSTPFGCQRRWVWRYVLGETEPETGSQSLGTELHAVLEARLCEHPEPKVSPEALRLANLFDVKSLTATVESVETWIEFPLWEQFNIRGRIDVATDTGVWDWKTTSSIQKYAKYGPALRNATPMLLYAHWWLEQHPEKAACLMTHCYFQTTGSARVELSEVTLTRADVVEGVARLKPLMEAMAAAAEHKDVLRVKPDYNKCRRCPFGTKCSEKESENLMRAIEKTETAVEVVKAEDPKAWDLELKATTVTVSWTVNLGDYNSLKVDYGITATGDQSAIESYVRAKIQDFAAQAIADRKAQKAK